MSAEQQRRSEAEDGPEPACQDIDGNWTREGATGGLLAFHEPCGYADCYPDGELEEGDTVVRARGTAGNKLHRPASEADEDGHEDDPGHASAVAAQLRLAEQNGTLPGGGDE